MAIFKTSYDTSVGIGYETNKIKNSIEKAYYLEEAKMIDDSIVAIFTGTNALPFQHPLFTIIDNEELFAIDIRQMTKTDIFNDFEDIKVRNRSEYNLLLTRAKLNTYWHNSPNPKELSNIIPKGMNIYSRWISSSLARRYALDYRDIAIIDILSALFYISLFTNEKEWDTNFLELALVKITKTMKIPNTLVDEVITDIDTPMVTIQSLTELIKEKTDSIRLKDLTPGVLISIISGTWFGNNHSELLAVGLEHPPTFISLVYTAIRETLYRQVGFTKIVKDVLKGEAKNVDSYITELLSLN